MCAASSSSPAASWSSSTLSWVWRLAKEDSQADKLTIARLKKFGWSDGGSGEKRGYPGASHIYYTPEGNRRRTLMLDIEKGLHFFGSDKEALEYARGQFRGEERGEGVERPRVEAFA